MCGCGFSRFEFGDAVNVGLGQLHRVDSRLERFRAHSPGLHRLHAGHLSLMSVPAPLVSFTSPHFQKRRLYEPMQYRCSQVPQVSPLGPLPGGAA